MKHLNKSLWLFLLPWITLANNSLSTADFIGTLNKTSLTFRDQVSAVDHEDYMAFDLALPGQVTITLDQLQDDASLGLYKKDGTLIGYSVQGGPLTEKLSYYLKPDRYVVRVTSWQHQANTGYRLTLKNSLRIVVPGPRPGTGIGGPIPRPLPPTRPPHTPNLGTIVVRGIPYVDHSPYTRLAVKTVLLGDYFNINTQTLNFNNQGTLKVFIQDVNTPTGLGVTGFELKGVHQYGRTLQIQAPWLHLFKNRTFHVTVFQYTGQKNNYAQAGTITFK